MIVAINTRFLLPHLEGIGVYTHEICQRLVRQNPDITFHFFFDRPTALKYLYAPNVTAHILQPPARHPFLWKLWYDWVVPRLLRKIKADVFFSPDNFTSLRTSVPCLMTTHDLAFEHYPDHIKSSHLLYFKKQIPKFHHRAEMIACVSSFTQSDIIEKYKIKKDKTFITHNGPQGGIRPLKTHEKITVKEKYTNGHEYFVMIGAIHPRKNVNNAIKAFETFKSSDITDKKLVIVGREAWKTNDFKNALNASTVKSDILHLEFVPDINDILGASSGLLYISLFEGFGIPILEAFQAKVPVITSNTSSMPEVAEDAAILVDPHNPDDISWAMKKISDPGVAALLIKNGLSQLQKFSWDESAQKIMFALKELGQKNS